MPEGKYTTKLFEFLENNRIKTGGKKPTHRSMGTPVGNFYFSGSNRDRLNRLISRSLKEGTKLHILECCRRQGPITFDIDLKYNSDDNERKYTHDNIKKTVEIFQNIISKYLLTDIDNINHCFITEKNQPTNVDKNIYKDGFHGQFVNTCVTSEVQHLIRQEVVNEFYKNNYFSNINAINKYDDIFDKAIITDNGWFVYGCGKPNLEPYKLTYMFNGNLENLISSYRIDDLYGTIDIMSRRRFAEDDLSEFIDGINDDIINNELKKLNINLKKKENKRKRSREYSEEDIQYAQKLTKLLSIDRSDEYRTWMEVGWALYNIDDFLLDDFIEFSQLSDSFKYGECEKRWDKMKNEGTNGLGLGSLVKWASEDNPEEFKKLKDQNEETIIRSSITGTSGDVARSFYHINKGKFKCASIKYSAWYEFKNHRWQPIDSATTIMLMLNDDYPKKYKKVADYFYYRSQQLEGHEKELFDKKREASLKVAENLTRIKFKNDIIAELKHRFYDEDFYNKLDENKFLIGCNNGVYDFKNEYFREGYPDDYISQCTNIDYIEYKEDDELILQIKDFFNQIQPEKDMYNYVLDYFSSCLVGHSPEELFTIWTGTGGNGKSLSIGLFQSMLGTYASTIGITLLTNKRAASNAASPEMANMKGKRFVVFQEPENDDKIHVGHMKELTGNDKISARALFKEPIEFYPQFKMLLTCNKLPFIPSNDGGTWRRLRVTPFEMSFVDNPKEPNQRKKDKYLKEKMEKWKEPFLYLLINRYNNRYKDNGLIEPEKIKKYTNDYKRQSDIYYEYISEQLEMTNNQKDKIILTTMYADFKMWYREAHTDRKIPSKSEFKDGIEEKIGKMRSTGFRNVRFSFDTKEQDDCNNDSDSDDIDDKCKSNFIYK